MRGQLQLACYALHLSTGNSIYGKLIKASTIECYVRAVAKFLKGYTGIDCRYDRDSRMGTYLTPTLKELRRYEKVPNRREAYDTTMHKLARKLALEVRSTSLISALADGFERGICAGLRCGEWAQPSGWNGSVSTPAQHPTQRGHIGSATRAIVPNDHRISTCDNRRLKGLGILAVPLSSIRSMWVKWRWQKNGEHGEEKKFARNPDSSGFCFVAATYRSLERFRDVAKQDATLDPSTTPLSVYWDDALSCASLITAIDIEEHMRLLAAVSYDLDPARDSDSLRLWSSHSLRVGAVVILHVMGFAPLDIQWLLRWKSTAFMVYLRNTSALAERQYRALDRAAAMPYYI